MKVDSAMMYTLVSQTFGFFLRLFGRIEVEGKENIPQEGPLLMIANHISVFDPLIVAAVFPRTINFMAMDRLFKGPLLKYLFPLLQTFPVKRDAPDRMAIKEALRRLSLGRVVGIFPEGRVIKDSAIHGVKEGAGIVAVRSHVPLIPLFIAGSRTLYQFKTYLFSRVHIQVKIGKAFKLVIEKDLPRNVQRAEAIKQIMDKISALESPA